MLVPITRANIAALRQRDPQSYRLDRYRQVAVLLTGNPKASPDEAVSWLEALCRELSIPRLQDMGVKQEDFPSLVEKAQKASSMKGNPIQLTNQELEETLREGY
jgi:alcohol dehydrogenase class IV